MALVFDGLGLAVKATTRADFASDPDIGEELHLHQVRAIARAGFAAPAFDVKGKAARLVAAQAGLGQLGKELADGRERVGVRGRVGAGRATDGLLVDADDFVEVFHALNCRVCARFLQGAVEDAVELFEDDVVDQRAFARAGDASDAGEQAEGDARLDVFEVVLARPFDD